MHGGFIHKGCIYEGVGVGEGEEKGKETVDFLTQSASRAESRVGQDGKGSEGTVGSLII